MLPRVAKSSSASPQSSREMPPIAPSQASPANASSPTGSGKIHGGIPPGPFPGLPPGAGEGAQRGAQAAGSASPGQGGRCFSLMIKKKTQTNPPPPRLTQKRRQATDFRGSSAAVPPRSTSMLPVRALQCCRGG